MKPVNIPVVGIGPGTQAESEDGMVLDYMPMPKEMNSFTPALIPDTEDFEGRSEAARFMLKLLQEVGNFRMGERNPVLDMGGLSADDLALIDDVLGEGEVAVVYQGEQLVRIQESVFPGVWRLRISTDGEELVHDSLEIGSIPEVVHTHSFINAIACAVPGDAERPVGLQNAMPVIHEIAEHSASSTRDSEAHVINFTLLPQTERDLEFLEKVLGYGPVSILSRGYGNCRITSTACHNVWWVQYFNSVDKLILNTLEIVSVPAVACASIEDIEDSAERLHEVLGVIE